MSGPYAEKYGAYLAAGFKAVPLPKAKKSPPPTGWTGYDAPTTMSHADAYTLAEDYPGGNIALVSDGTWIGLDVDAYVKGGRDKPGLDTITDLTLRYGPLPPTWVSSARHDFDPVSGIRYFRVPPGTRLITSLPGIEVIQRHHRYAVTWPSQHPEVDACYQWRRPDRTLVNNEDVPRLAELPALPDRWLAGLASDTAPREAKAEPSQWDDWFEVNETSPVDDVLSALLRTYQRSTARGGSHYEAARDLTFAAMGQASEGRTGVPTLLRQAEHLYLGYAVGARGRSAAHVEWARMLDGAKSKFVPPTGDVRPDPTNAEFLTALAPTPTPTPAATQAPTKGRMKVRRASAVTTSRTRWLYAGHLPEGEMTLLAGREGIGKSTLCYHLVAQVTQGRLPGENEGIPRNVLIAATEDDWSRTIVPRLIAEGADLDRVLYIDSVARLDEDGCEVEAMLSLPDDLAELEDVIREEQVAMVLLDPLISRMSSRLDSHRDMEVRQGLEPLVSIGHRTGCAMLGIIHVNKSQNTDILQSVMGSAAFTAVPRAVLAAMRDPKDSNLRLWGIAKCNIGPDSAVAHRFRIEAVQQEATDGTGDVLTTSRYVDEGPADVNIREVLTVAEQEEKKEKRERSTEVGRCEKFIREVLAGGEKYARSYVLERASEQEFASRTVERAFRNLGGHSKVVVDDDGKPAVPRKVWWYLPEQDDLDALLLGGGAS